jgi:hypothetical protein
MHSRACQRAALSQYPQTDKTAFNWNVSGTRTSRIQRQLVTVPQSLLPDLWIASECAVIQAQSSKLQDG